MKIGYARTDGNEASLVRQEAQLRKAGCERLFIDDEADVRPALPGLYECLAALDAGDLLVTASLDRPAHSLANLVELLEGLAARGVGFRSLREGIDTSGADGALISHVIGALADFQRTLISEKTRAGMAAAQAQGRHLGRPRSLDDEQIAAARRAIEKDGETATTVAARFGIHPRTLQRLLREQGRGTAIPLAAARPLVRVVAPPAARAAPLRRAARDS